MCAAPKFDRREPVPGGTPGDPVTLRWALPEDAEMLHAWRAEPSASRYQPLRQIGVEELRDRLRAQAGVVLGPAWNGDARWIVERDGLPVGTASLWVTDRTHGIGAIGYTIGEAHRRQGIATSATRLLASLAFDPTGPDLARLEAVAAIGNRASQRVLERAGFTREGRARGLLVIAGERVDHYRYGLLRDGPES